MSDHYGVCLKLSDLNDNQNNTREDEQEKKRNWNAVNRFTNVLELIVDLSIQLKSKDDFFGLCTAEEGIRNLEKIIYKTLDLMTPKKSSHTKKMKLYYQRSLKCLFQKTTSLE